MSGNVSLQVDDKIAWVTLDRPAKLNALSYAMVDRLLAILDEVEVDSRVGAIVLTGAGSRAFSAGAEIPEFAGSVDAGAERAVRDFVRRGQTLTARIEAFGKPIIAAVNGLAYGAGCEITEAAHLAIACEGALFAKPEIKLGMPPTFGGTQRLPRLVGRKRALDLLLTGEPFSAQKALDIGLINAVVPAADLHRAATTMAERILQHAPGAIRAILTAVARGLNMGIAEGLQMESEQFARLVAAREVQEGLAVWSARRAAAG